MNKIVTATTLATVTPIDMGDYYPYVWLKNKGEAVEADTDDTEEKR